MARVEKNATGKTVPVDTPEYGCVTMKHKAAPKTKLADAKPLSDNLEGDS